MGKDGCQMNRRRFPTMNKTLLLQPGKVLGYDNKDSTFY